MNRVNTVCEIQEVLLWERLLDHQRALSFDLELTARCNNDCAHCYINLPGGDRAAKGKELTLEEIARIADEAIELGALWVLVSGGEPLLRDDFADIYLLLKRKGLLVSVFTNATLIIPEHVELFRKYPPRDLEVSVYGATKETYESVTRRLGSWAAFRRGLSLLEEGSVRVRLKAMVLRSNVHELSAMSAFCRAHTKDYYRFDPLLHCRFDGDEERNAEIRAERLSPEEIAAIEHADAERFGALSEHCDEFIFEGDCGPGCDHLFHCGAGNGSFSVGYDGTFRLCSSLWAPGTTYDLRTGTLKEAWEQIVPRVRDMRSSNPEFLKTCRTCPIVRLCLWCPAHAHLETREMDRRVDYFCRVAHARARSLGYTGEMPAERDAAAPDGPPPRD